jgi:predicted GNAT family acetyltransferase
MPFATLQVAWRDRLHPEYNVKSKSYANAESFLESTRSALESRETANSLMLGICGQLARHPERSKTTPCLKMVEDENGLVLAAMMTPPHKLVVYGHQGDLDGAARTLIEELVGEGWQIPGVLGPSAIASKAADGWTAVTGREYRLEGRQKVYELRKVVGPVPQRGKLRKAEEADSELVARWWHGFHVDIFGEADRDKADEAARFRIEAGDIYLWEDEQLVSMALKTRPTSKGISISAVYTPPELRCKGYATACVGELSRMLLEEGWEFCALFADVENNPAIRVYTRIGYRPICDYDAYEFLGEG